MTLITTLSRALLDLITFVKGLRHHSPFDGGYASRLQHRRLANERLINLKDIIRAYKALHYDYTVPEAKFGKRYSPKVFFWKNLL